MPTSTSPKGRPADPVTAYAQRVVAGKIVAGPLVRAASAVHVADPKGSRVYDKRKSTGRIDDLVALAMAAGLADSSHRPPPVISWRSTSSKRFSDALLASAVRRLQGRRPDRRLGGAGRRRWFFQGRAGVTPQAALQATVVLACVRVLAEGIAQLPFYLHRSNGRGAEPARQHPLYTIISRRPNEWQTSLEWRETMMIHAVLTGDGLSFINRVGGTIRELIPLLPGTVTIEQQSDYSLQYRVAFADGRQELLPRSQVWHLRGPSWNAYSGLDALRLAREAIGLALATEETHARFHGNGARPPRRHPYQRTAAEG